MNLEPWNEGGVAETCTGFQIDLSCLLDNELDEGAAGRAMVHMEACASCREFFEDSRQQLEMHRDMATPERIFARLSMLTGRALPSGQDSLEQLDLVHRLSSVFYQIGKAYVLAAIDPGYRERVFESVIPVDAAQSRGRGFVDGVIANGRGQAGGLDWQRARAMLNGKLERIDLPLEKGRKLLQEAIAIDPSHEEARLYMAFLHGHEGKRLLAADEYLDIFQTAVEDSNRGHAAIQLGRLHSAEQSYRRAIACWRWITISGLADRDDRFFVARFNIGMVYALERNQRRALDYFRQLLDRHPTRVAEVAELFARSPKLRTSIDAQPGFAEALVRTCPELFSGALGGSSDQQPTDDFNPSGV